MKGNFNGINMYAICLNSFKIELIIHSIYNKLINARKIIRENFPLLRIPHENYTYYLLSYQTTAIIL